MRVLLAVVIAMSTLVAGEAAALTVIDVKTSSLSLDIGAQVFARTRTRKIDDGDFDTRFELARARLSVSMRFGPWLRADLEPDFAGGQADIADVFLQIAPVAELDLRIGQAKVPFGFLESTGRWRVPSLRRGMINSIVFDRLGFQVRQLGARARIRLPQVALRPIVELGIYGTPDDTFTDHGAGRASVRLMKGTRLALAGYTAGKAAAGDKRGYAGALSFLVDRKRLFAGAEVQLGFARLLAATGLEPGVDATYLAARAIAAYRFEVGSYVELEPYAAVELFEPNLSTRDDLSYAGRAGLNVYCLRWLRMGIEADYQAGQTGAVVLDEVIITGFAGVRLE